MDDLLITVKYYIQKDTFVYKLLEGNWPVSTKRKKDSWIFKTTSSKTLTLAGDENGYNI